MSSGHPAKPWVEAAVLGIALLAILIAGAAAGALASSEAWTLLALVASGYILSRGLAAARRPVPRSVPRSEPVPAPAPAPAPAATPPPAPAPAPEAVAGQTETAAEVVLSEERLKVTSRPRPRERVQVRKEIVTEEVTITVPVRREELRIDRVPLDAPEDPASELDMTLMTHEPVVAKEIVPRERVRLQKDVVVDREQVSEPVRREQVDIERRGPRDPEQGAR